MEALRNKFKKCPQSGKEEFANGKISLQPRLTKHTGKKQFCYREGPNRTAIRKNEQIKSTDIEKKARKGSLTIGDVIAFIENSRAVKRQTSRVNKQVHHIKDY